MHKWFLIDTLTKEGDTNNTHAKVMRDCDQNYSLKKKPRVSSSHEVLGVNWDVPHTDLITGTHMTKSSLHVKTNAIFWYHSSNI